MSEPNPMPGVAPKRRLLFFLCLILFAFFLGGLAFVVSYQQAFGGFWYVFLYILLHLLFVSFEFFELARAFVFSVRSRLIDAARARFGAILVCTLYQFLAAFLDYELLKNYEVWDAFRIAFLSSILDGLIVESVLLLAYFFIPWLLFLRGADKTTPPPSLRTASPLLYAGIAAAVLHTLSGFAQQTVSMLRFLSEHFWIANSGEVLSFILFYLFELGLSLVGFAVLILTERRLMKSNVR